MQVSAGNRVTLRGSAIQTGDGRIVAGTLNVLGTPSGIDLGGANQISVVENVSAVFLNRIRNIGDLRITGTFGGASGGNAFTRIDVENGSLTLAGSILADRQSNNDVNILARASGNILLEGGSVIRGGAGSSSLSVGVRLQAGFDFASGAVNPLAPGGIQLAGTLVGANPSQPATTTARVELGAGLGGIVQTGGQLRATTLSLQSGGNALLNINGNVVDRLGPSTVAGNLSLTMQRTTAFDFSLDGAINVGGTLALVRNGSGSIVQTTGSVITANRLDATVPVNGLTLDGDNRIAELGNVVAEFPLFIRNAGPLRVVGLVSGRNTSVRLDVVGDLDVLGTIEAIAQGVDLRASGSIRLATGGVIQLVSFNGGPTADAVLNLRAGFDFAGGAVNPASPGGIVLAGRVGNPGELGAINLAAGTGGITQTGGQLLGTRLTVASGGNATLGRATAGTPNSLQRLEGVAVAGNFTLDNGAGNLLVRGANSAGSYAIRTAGELVIQADVAAGSRASFRVGSLRILAPVVISPSFTEPGGTVTAALVEIAPFVQNTVLLPVAPARTPLPGEFLLSTTTLSRISTSTLRIGATTFDGVTGTSADGVFFLASYSFPGTLDLRAINNIGQAAGTTVSAGRLAGVAGGAFTLANANNILPQIEDITAGTTLSLRTTANQVLNGALLAPGVSLTTGGSLAQLGAGRIGNGTLSLQVGGDATLGGGNTLAALGASSIGGALLLRNTSTQLTVPAGNTVTTGGAMTIAQAGNFVVDGTVSGTATTLSATERLQVNGNSAIARTGALGISAGVFGLNGLLQAATEINVNATSEANFTGRAFAPALNVTAPRVGFGLLDASGAQVSLFLGSGGTTSGTLNAGGLRVFGGSGAGLFGTISGVAGGPAAVLGRRGTAGGTLLNEPLGQPNAFLFNNCPIGVAVCQPILIPPPVRGTEPQPVIVPEPPLTIVAGPPPVFFELFAFQSLSGSVVLGERTRPNIDLTLRTGRDRSEESELAPPNIRSEDF